MPRLITAYAEVKVFMPYLTGQIVDNGQGYARNLGFVEPRAKTLMGSGANQEPGLDAAVWELFQTRMAHSVNGLALAEMVQPRDMNLSEWDWRVDVAGSLSTAFVADDLDRQWFYLDAVDDTAGQNVGHLSGNTASAGSGTVAPTFTQRNKGRFVSHWSIGANQGWEYQEIRYSGLGAEVLQLSGYMEAPGGSVMGPATVVDSAINAVTTETIHHSATFLYWSVGSVGNVVWCLAIPTNRGKWGSMLLKSVDGGSHWRIVDRHMLVYSYFGGMQHAGPQQTRVRYSVENGTAVFHLGDDPIPWRFRDPESASGFSAPAGKVGVFWAGGVGAFNHSVLAAPSAIGGGLILGGAVSGPNQLASWLNSDPADASVKLLPAGASSSTVVVTGDIVTGAQLVAAGATDPGIPNDPSVYWLEVQATTTGTGAGPITMPIILGLQEIRKAKVTATSTLVGDITPDTLAITWKRKKRRRGTEVTFSVKNDTGQWDALKKNQAINLRVGTVIGNDDGTTTIGALSQVFLGHIVSVGRPRGGRYAYTPGMVEIVARDWEFQLADKKSMRDMPSFGGWELADALAYICNRCGIDAAYYDFSSMGTGWILDTPQVSGSGRGHLSFYYTDQVRPIHAMDQMCASKGWEWYVDLSGIIKPKQVGTFDLSYAYTLDDTTAPPGTDCLRDVEANDTADGFANVSIVSSRGLDGSDTIARWEDHASQYDPTSINYVGDDWWDVHQAPPGIDPWPYAKARIESLAKYGQPFKWTSDLNFQLLPGQLVTINITHTGITPGTKLELLEEEVKLDFPSYSFEQTFIVGSSQGAN